MTKLDRLNNRKPTHLIKFCIADDEQRDRFYNHEIDGPIAHEEQDVEGEDCRALCLGQEKVRYFDDHRLTLFQA